MIRRTAMGLMLAVGACAPMPSAAGDWIEVASGGGFSGYQATRIYASGLIETTLYASGQSTPKVGRKQAPVGAYLRAREVVAARLPAVARGATKEICMDYGTDAVRTNRPVGAVLAAEVTCPDDGVSALMADVLAAIQPSK